MELQQDNCIFQGKEKEKKMILEEEFKLNLFSYKNNCKEVYEAGEGPAIIVMHEVPGLYPAVAEFGLRLVKEGFKVYLPSLCGEPGKDYSNQYIAQSFKEVCISKEFTIFATRKSSPVTEWLRALARHAHEKSGKRPVGAVGMCLTGGFALSMMLDDFLMAPVLSQPSLPVPYTPAQRNDLGIDDETLKKVKERVAGGCEVMGLRFSHDPLCPKQRFKRLKKELGNGFIEVEIDSSIGNPYGNRLAAHSVLVYDLKDTPGHPTQDALYKVIDFYKTKLL